MNHDHDKPMWDDPAESSRLRQLLRAGRQASSSSVDYDVEQGLARHLANLQAGAALPEWAEGMRLVNTGSGFSLTWVMVPLLAAASFGGVWLVARDNSEPTPRITARPQTELAVNAAAAPAPGLEVVAIDRARQPQPADPRGSERSDSDARETGHSSNAVERSASARRNRGHGASDESRSTHNADDQHLQARAIGTRGSASDTNRSGGPVDSGRNPGSTDSAPVTTTPVTAVIESAVVAATATVAPAATRSVVRPNEPQSSAAQPVAPPPTAASDAQPTRGDDSRLEREMQMLAVAQRVLLDDPDRSLRLARQGEREFADSMFSAERKQLGLLALVQLGRLEEARKLGRPFLETYPNAPWSERLRQSLATGRIPLR